MYIYTYAYIIYIYTYVYQYICIKMSGSESRGQEEAACMRVIGLCDHYSELFTQMEALNF